MSAETAVGFDRLIELVEAGCSASEALDYAATVDGDWTQTEWGRIRGVGQGAVAHNVAGARDELGE